MKVDTLPYMRCDQVEHAQNHTPLEGFDERGFACIAQGLLQGRLVDQRAHNGFALRVGRGG